MNQLQSAIEMMRNSGLRYQDIARLTWLRYQIRTGKRTEISLADKRLLFARFLVQQRQLDG